MDDVERQERRRLRRWAVGPAVVLAMALIGLGRGSLSARTEGSDLMRGPGLLKPSSPSARTTALNPFNPEPDCAPYFERWEQSDLLERVSAERFESLEALGGLLREDGAGRLSDVQRGEARRQLEKLRREELCWMTWQMWRS